MRLQGKKVVLTVGALRTEKRIDVLLQAYGHLRRMSEQLALVIVGDGPLRAELERLVVAESLEDVHFVGRHIESDAHPYFAMADLFVLPGTGGLALNQAMAFGKPVICSVADGTERDLVQDGVTGIIVPAATVPGLRAAMEAILFDDAIAAEMGKKSIRLIREKINLPNFVADFAAAAAAV